MQRQNNLNILDCTFRDGGYYNNWDFRNQLVNKYVRNINQSNIDIVEIGFRFLKEDKFGKFSTSKERLINKLKFKKKISISVMVNGADLKTSDNYKKIINKNFVKKRNSKISIIRIASHLKDLKNIIPQIKYLKSLGYFLALNLMQIDKIKDKELIRALKDLKNTKSVDVFYFADSFGNLNQKQVKKICSLIKKNWKKDFGFHAHDNCGLAFKNSLTAIKEGASWIDCTIQGMGRGAGNLKTEQFLNYIKNKEKFKKINITPINDLANNEFKKLKKKYNWGKSVYYNLSAKKNVHPSYVQVMLADNRYKHKEVLNIINNLSKIKSSSYNPLLLQDLLNEKIQFKKCWNAKNWCKNRNILILGQGKSIRKRVKDILKIIKNKNCIVLSLNINNTIPDKLINYYVACHEARILIDYKKYKNFSKKLIIPTGRFEKIIKIKFPDQVKNYGMIVKKEKFNIKNQYCELPNNLAVSYALAVSLAGKAKNIFLAGFDGYARRKNLNLEMETFLKLIKKDHSYIKLNNLTPSKYST